MSGADIPENLIVTLRALPFTDYRASRSRS
jgi:hypothetical protein